MSSEVLTSELLPVPHGFSTRAGGTSPKPFDSLNLGFGVGDAPDRVRENHARLAGWAGLPLERLFTVVQVHGARVLEVAGAPEAPLQPSGEADALWTGAPGAWVGVRTADCVPILLVDPAGRRVAAVHSGWRGTLAGVVTRAVEALVDRGASREGLLAAVGPAIGPCCYEVSEELAGRFAGRFEAAVVERAGSAVRLDLPRAVALTLAAAGLKKDHVDVLQRCTACEAEVFYSHRRDRGVTGRQLSFVACAF